MRALRVLQERASVVRERVRAAALDQLRGDPDGVAAAQAACREADREAERVLGHPDALRPACTRGCSSCCHVHVEATGSEIEAVAVLVRATRTPEALDELTVALARAADLTPEARWAARVPCALLAADGTCSVHEARPLRCRAFHSCSAEACRRAFEGADVGPVTSAALERVYDAAEAGLDAALAERGVSPAAELLEAGLLRRLRVTPTACTRS